MADAAVKEEEHQKADAAAKDQDTRRVDATAKEALQSAEEEGTDEEGSVTQEWGPAEWADLTEGTKVRIFDWEQSPPCPPCSVEECLCSGLIVGAPAQDGRIYVSAEILKGEVVAVPHTHVWVRDRSRPWPHPAAGPSA